MRFVALSAGMLAIYFFGFAIARYTAPDARFTRRVRLEARRAIDVYEAIWRDLSEQPDVQFDQSHTVRVIERQAGAPFDWARD